MDLACGSGVFTGDYHRELLDELGIWHSKFAIHGVFEVAGFYSSPTFPRSGMSEVDGWMDGWTELMMDTHQQELYVFCGVAAVIGNPPPASEKPTNQPSNPIGISTGAILGLASYFLSDTLDSRDEPAAPGQLGRAGLKDGRIRSAAKNTATTPHTDVANTKMSARVLFPQAIPTILEEEDEDSPFLVGGSGGKRGAGRVKRTIGWSGEDEEDESSG
ncbi:hypothetical protein HOY80DRAFT_997041 [Tuber brumale]|nr:hypothetical protein HOY80DRAFT_997041 [Tuber brumale]